MKAQFIHYMLQILKETRKILEVVISFIGQIIRDLILLGILPNRRNYIRCLVNILQLYYMRKLPHSSLLYYTNLFCLI